MLLPILIIFDSRLREVEELVTGLIILELYYILWEVIFQNKLTNVYV